MKLQLYTHHLSVLKEFLLPKSHAHATLVLKINEIVQQSLSLDFQSVVPR